MSNNPFPLTKEKLLEAYRMMRTIREFEERLHVDFARGDIAGFVHLYAGEEATAAGIMMHLNDQRPNRLDPQRARPLHRQGRRREGNDGRNLRQGDRRMPRQGRFDAYRRSRRRA